MDFISIFNDSRYDKSAFFENKVSFPLINFGTVRVFLFTLMSFYYKLQWGNFSSPTIETVNMDFEKMSLNNLSVAGEYLMNRSDPPLNSFSFQLKLKSKNCSILQGCRQNRNKETEKTDFKNWYFFVPEKTLWTH